MERSTKRTSIVLLLCVSLAQTLSSQESHLVPGEHIRLHQTNPCCAATVTGILLSATSDSVSYRPPGIAEVIALPRASILGVDRRTAAGDRKAEGAGLGLIVGAIVAGVLLGVDIGSRLDWEKWEPAVLPLNVSLIRPRASAPSR